MLRYSYLIILLCACCLSWKSSLSIALADPTSGQIVKDSSTPNLQLKEVIIHAIYQQSQHLNSPTPLQIIDKKTIQRLNSLSVADAVRYLSGVQLKDYGGIGGLKTLNVRSMGSQHTTVFYNGLPIENTQNGQIDLGKFSLTNLNSIKLYNGQSSYIFQPAKAYASGATLYLESKTPKFKPGENTHASAVVKTGSFGLITGSAHWEQKLGKRVSGSISTEYTQANGKYSFRYTNGIYDTTAIRQNADMAAWRLEAGLNGTLSDSSMWSIHGYHYQSKRGLPGAIVSNHFDHYQRLWNKDDFVQGKFSTVLTSRYALKFNAQYDYHYTHYLDPFFPNNQHELSNFYREKEFYVSLANRYHLMSYWDADLSIDYHWDQLKANTYHFSYPTRQTILTALATRLHFSRFQLEGSLLATFVTDKVKQYGTGGQQNEYTPSLSFSWQPFQQTNLRLRGFYKNIFRMPTFNDLYYTLMGAAHLNPEFVKQFDFGLTYRKTFESGILKYLSMTIDGYHNRVTDKIIAAPGANLFRWNMINLGKGDTKGIDLHTENQFFIAQQIYLNIGLSYTFQNALNVTDRNYQYKNKIPYAPEHSGSATTSAAWKNWRINYSFLYTGARYVHTANTYRDHLPAWYTHDVSIHKKWQWKKCRIKLTAEINNIANHHYEVVKGYPMPRRSFRIGINIFL